MLFHDLLHDRQPQAGTLVLGGNVGLEQPSQEVGVDAGPIVAHQELHVGVVILLADPAHDLDPGVGPPIQCLVSILDQVVYHLAQAQGIPIDLRLARLQADIQDISRVGAQVQLDHLGHQPIQDERGDVHLGRPGVVRKGIDHGLHRLDLLDYGVGRPVQHLEVPGHGLFQVLAPEALRGELDRRQGVLDLMGETPRDLAPCRVPLRLDQGGDVIEHQHVTTLALGVDEGAAATQQHLPALAAEEGQLLAGLGLAQQHAPDELHQGTQPLVVIRQARDAEPQMGLQLQTQDLMRGGIGSA